MPLFGATKFVSASGADLSKPAAVGTVGTGGKDVTEVAVGLDTVGLVEALSEVATGATAAAGATMGPPLAASAAAVLCCVTAAPCTMTAMLKIQSHSMMQCSVS